VSRSGAHEALHDHRLDLLIASLTAAPVPMPECETAAAAGDSSEDDMEYAVWDDLEERYLR